MNKFCVFLVVGSLLAPTAHAAAPRSKGSLLAYSVSGSLRCRSLAEGLQERRDNNSRPGTSTMAATSDQDPTIQYTLRVESNGDNVIDWQIVGDPIPPSRLVVMMILTTADQGANSTVFYYPPNGANRDSDARIAGKNINSVAFCTDFATGPETTLPVCGSGSGCPVDPAGLLIKVDGGVAGSGANACRCEDAPGDDDGCTPEEIDAGECNDPGGYFCVYRNGVYKCYKTK